MTGSTSSEEEADLGYYQHRMRATTVSSVSGTAVTTVPPRSLIRGIRNSRREDCEVVRLRPEGIRDLLIDSLARDAGRDLSVLPFRRKVLRGSMSATPQQVFIVRDGGIVDPEVTQLAAQMTAAGSEKTKEALKASGLVIPGPGDIPDKAWDKMRDWQVWSLLILMFLVIAAIFVGLLWKGLDLATAKHATETAKTLGNTLVGAALGLLGATAVGAGGAVVSK